MLILFKYTKQLVTYLCHVFFFILIVDVILYVKKYYHYFIMKKKFIHERWNRHAHNEYIIKFFLLLHTVIFIFTTAQIQVPQIPLFPNFLTPSSIAPSKQ